MSFTDRFLELPVILMYITDGDTDNPIDQYEKTIEMVNPLEISSFHPDDSDTHIFMKNGRSIMTTMGFNEFQERVNAHMEGQIKK